MKMSKRIFTVLLAFAVIISSFALFASADETDPETVEIKDYSYVLNYYEEQVIFGYDLNGGGDFDYKDALLASHKNRVTDSVVIDETAPGGKYLNIAITEAEPWGEESVFLNWNSQDGIESFYFDTTVSAGSVDGFYLPKYRLIVGSESFTNIANSLKEGTAILTLDFHFGRLSYVSGVDENGAAIETVADYELSGDAWYSVSLDYTADGASITVTNVADSSDTVTVTDVYLPYEVVKNIRFGVHAVDNTDAGPDDDGYHDSNGNYLKIADISAATGTERFNTANRQKGLEDSVLEIYSVYTSEDIEVDKKTVLCEIVNKLIAYGFTSDNAEVQAAVEDIKFGSVTLYSDALEKGLAELPTISDYYEKRAKIEKTLEYADVLDTMDLSPVGEEAAKVIVENIAALRAAHDDIKQVEVDSLNFIAGLAGADEVLGTADYMLLKGYYDAVAGITPDLTYEGVAEVYACYLDIVSAMDEIAADAEIFIDEVERLGDTSRDFMHRYAEYLAFKDSIDPNTTYPGVTETLAYYNDVVLPDILYNISLAENFVMYVERADFATYISAKEENIRIADEYMALCHPDFEGVKEAKELRLTIIAYIDEQKANALAYIEAVNALDSLTGDALVAGIARAESLKEAGDVLGVDGVTEANIKLNKITSEISLKSKYSDYLVTLVESLYYVYEAEDIYLILVEAVSIQNKVDINYPGVADALLDLELAIENYNIMVSEMNEEFKTANVAAANTVGIGTDSNTVADHVIALVQSFFYEEEKKDEEEESK